MAQLFPHRTLADPHIGSFDEHIRGSLLARLGPQCCALFKPHNNLKLLLPHLTDEETEADKLGNFSKVMLLVSSRAGI